MSDITRAVPDARPDPLTELRRVSEDVAGPLTDRRQTYPSTSAESDGVLIDRLVELAGCLLRAAQSARFDMDTMATYYLTGLTGLDCPPWARTYRAHDTTLTRWAAHRADMAERNATGREILALCATLRGEQ